MTPEAEAILVELKLLLGLDLVGKTFRIKDTGHRFRVNRALGAELEVTEYMPGKYPVIRRVSTELVRTAQDNDALEVIE